MCMHAYLSHLCCECDRMQNSANSSFGFVWWSCDAHEWKSMWWTFVLWPCNYIHCNDRILQVWNRWVWMRVRVHRTCFMWSVADVAVASRDTKNHSLRKPIDRGRLGKRVFYRNFSSLKSEIIKQKREEFLFRSPEIKSLLSVSKKIF